MSDTEDDAQRASDTPTSKTPLDVVEVEAVQTKHALPAEVEVLLQALRQRAHKAEGSARKTFVTIVFLMVAAAMMIAAAGAISDATQEGRIEEARESAARLAAKAAYTEQNVGKSRNVKTGDPANVYTEYDATLLRSHAEDAQAQVKAMEHARAATSLSVRDVEAIGIRLSTVVMLVFLVQILSAQHRYSSRLAAHYHAVGDTILRMKETGLKSPQDFQILVKAFFPDASFGREPKTLPKEVADLVAGLAKRN